MRVGLPFGGAKGGVRVNSRGLSRAEKQRLTRRYTMEIINFIGPDRDIPAPDMGTDEQVMAWLMDTYSTHVGHSEPAVVTGKPPALGGSVALVPAQSGFAISLRRARPPSRSLDHQGWFRRSKLVRRGVGSLRGWLIALCAR
jgi:glutamate dehydrogenase (NAD(P)+)